MAKVPQVGALAPDFTLPGVVVSGDAAGERSDYSLSAQRGRPVVLAFYPGDETAVCTKQLCAYQNDLGRFTELGATVWGISQQDLDSHERFARKFGLEFPLLADVQSVAVKAYGVGLLGIGLRRSIFLIDAEGILRWKHIALVGVTYQDVETIAAKIAAL